MARPAHEGLQLFWRQLCTVKQLVGHGSAQFLDIGPIASFPLEGNAVGGRIYARQCYIDLHKLLEQHVAQGGRSMIVTGTPGIGKSLFIYFLMWKLARSGTTIVWDRLYVTPVMFSSHGVLEGPLSAFSSQLHDPATWYLVDGHPPQIRAATTVLVASPDYLLWKDAFKRPHCVLRHMPPWSWEEIHVVHQQLFSRQPEPEVALRFTQWGGIPRFVLQQTDACVQAFLKQALDSCTLKELTRGLTNISGASDCTHRLMHLTVSHGYLEGPVVFASKFVEGELLSRFPRFRPRHVYEFLLVSSGKPAVADFRGLLWERRAHQLLQRGGAFFCRDLQTQGPAFELTVAPCWPSIELSDLQDISLQLKDGMYGWGSSQALAGINAVVQPNKLFQITAAGQHGINPRGLTDAVRAIQAAKQDVQLFFVVPPDVFSSYTRQTLKRIREDLEAAHVAPAVMQYVLRLDTWVP